MGKHSFHFKKNTFNYDEYKRKILCKICGKICTASKYSKRQLDELRKAMASNPGVTGLTRPGFAGCRTCISHQTVELTCCICDKTKSLEYFSKNQRSPPDTARCTNCVQSHLDAEPIAEVLRDMEEGEAPYDPSAVAESKPADANEIAHFQHLSVNDEARPRKPVSHRKVVKPGNRAGVADSEDDVSFGGVWVEQQDEGTTTTTVPEGAKEVVEFTAFDNKGTGHPRKTTVEPALKPTMPEEKPAVPSAVWNITTKERRVATTRKRSNFAKVTGVRVSKDEAPTQRLPEPTGPTIDYDDDSDDECGIEAWI
ncbi:hypothetical protein MGYG_02296 [Nannizzia gypsea CBS 118893]|uniref:Stc1 domain-containing protein n=1 Tax=Arthroderma gypseum (strain ATCC MYA-4604 / CBS 118893) TaxID=535722 RepID=E4UQV7_ARTGP|nr:hypothetical protein MGYG_02296 [Nannizzia gypsea CBS 118893]EFQ99283.1 hypothetical protein MGYG_02296 [Nannizzia gypsea CBS 118893]